MPRLSLNHGTLWLQNEGDYDDCDYGYVVVDDEWANRLLQNISDI